jgi:ABC-type iron transport system FetAB permease component
MKIKRIGVLALMVLPLAATFTAAIAQTATTAVKRYSVPEIDPAQAVGALVLLTGVVAIVRGVRRRKK